MSKTLMKKISLTDNLNVAVFSDGTTKFSTTAFDGDYYFWFIEGVSKYTLIENDLRDFLSHCSGQYVNTNFGIVFFELDKDAFFCKIRFGGKIVPMKKEAQCQNISCS